MLLHREGFFQNTLIMQLFSNEVKQYDSGIKCQYSKGFQSVGCVVYFVSKRGLK